MPGLGARVAVHCQGPVSISGSHQIASGVLSGSLGNLVMWILGFRLPPLAPGLYPWPPSPLHLTPFPACSSGPEDIGPPIPEADELLNK